MISSDANQLKIEVKKGLENGILLLPVASGLSKMLNALRTNLHLRKRKKLVFTFTNFRAYILSKKAVDFPRN